MSVFYADAGAVYLLDLDQYNGGTVTGQHGRYVSRHHYLLRTGKPRRQPVGASRRTMFGQRAVLHLDDGTPGMVSIPGVVLANRDCADDVERAVRRGHGADVALIAERGREHASACDACQS